MSLDYGGETREVGAIDVNIDQDLDFKTFIRISGMTHVRTAPYYPQSNGKIERWHKTIKSDALRPANPSSLEEARRLMERFVEYYNGVRLHSAKWRESIERFVRERTSDSGE